MQISGIGALVGAGVCAVARAGVVLLMLGPDAVIVTLPSGAIGLLVGAIAGALGKPIRGAIVGAVLSGVVFELFMCVCASVIGDIGRFFGSNDAGSKFLTQVLPYTLLMALAGAIGGGVGGFVARGSTGVEAASIDRDAEVPVVDNEKTVPDKAAETPRTGPSTDFKEFPGSPD